MTIIAAGIVLLIAAYIFKNYFWLLIKAKWYGTETEASVSRIEEEEMSARGTGYGYLKSFRYRTCYAAFQAKDGLQNEARLLNPNSRLTAGSRIRIRYLPEKADCAVLTEIIEL